jgi:pilus assembly protein CpaE
VNLAGVRVNQFLLQMLQLADRKFLVADQSVLSCGAARRLVEALEGHGVAASEVGLVVDRYTKRLSPSAARIAEMLGLPLTATLPPNGILKVEAMNSGTSIFEIAPRCPYARTVRSFARGLLDMGPGPASGSSSSGWARWLRAGSR